MKYQVLSSSKNVMSLYNTYKKTPMELKLHFAQHVKYHLGWHKGSLVPFMIKIVSIWTNTENCSKDFSMEITSHLHIHRVGF